MNRRARKRLLIATLVLVTAFAVAVVWIVRSQGAYYRQVSALHAGDDGKVVKVGGAIVEGTLTHGDSGYRFTMHDFTEEDETIGVTYAGQVPDAFGPGAEVVVVGRYDAGSRAIVAEELQTKCPSRYQASASPAP